MARRYDAIRGLFADQFSDSGDGRILFRRSGHGAAIPVTAEERDDLIARYNRELTLMTWVGVIASLGLIAGVIALLSLAKTAPADIVIFALIFVACAPVVAGQLWAWGGPGRYLAGRAAVSEPLPTGERRARAMSAIRWPGLAVAAGTGLVALFLTDWNRPLTDVDNIMCLGAAGLLVGLSAVQACRKLAYERGRKQQI